MDVRLRQTLAGVLGAQGDEGIRGDGAARFLTFLAGNEAVDNRIVVECSAGRQWIRLQRLAQDGGYGSAGWKVGVRLPASDPIFSDDLKLSTNS